MPCLDLSLARSTQVLYSMQYVARAQPGAASTGSGSDMFNDVDSGSTQARVVAGAMTADCQ